MSRRTTDHSGADDERAPVDSSADPHIFGDEHTLDLDDGAFVPVANGFRPAGASGPQPSSTESQDHDRSGTRPLPSPSVEEDENTNLERASSRSSAVKRPCARDSISSDARNPATSHSRAPSTQTAAALRRHASISSIGSFATTSHSESAFRTGPSHPYAMYTQHTMGRTPSVASSTPRGDRSSLLPHAPAHPYSLYPQNIIEGDEPPMAPMPPAIPVGFPGLSLGYHRRIGPDGEEQDIIGPDGHTEQLPPYSRYPEEGPTKAALAAEASASQVATPTSALPATADSPDRASPVSSTSPLSLSPAPLIPDDQLPPPQAAPPAPSSQEVAAESRDVRAPEPTSPQSAASSASLSSAEGGEKQLTEDCAMPWWKRRVCGKIPAGVAVAILLALVIFATVLGAAIGTHVTKKNYKGSGRGSKDHDGPSPQVTGPTNPLFDATPIATPPAMAPLPTGSFALPLGIAQESSKNCLTVSDQLPAWSCKMTFVPLVLSINYTDTSPSLPMASVGPLPKPDQTIQYGIQPPELGTIALELVSDSDMKVYGPAYHLDSTYDKIVVINQDEFSGGAFAPAERKREEKPAFRHRFQVMPGDSPWYCFWNATYIEGYIYVEDNSTAATFTNFPTAWPSLPVETAALPTPTDGGVPPAPPSPAPIAPPKRRSTGFYPRYAPYPRIVKNRRKASRGIATAVLPANATP